MIARFDFITAEGLAEIRALVGRAKASGLVKAPVRVARQRYMSRQDMLRGFLRRHGRGGFTTNQVLMDFCRQGWQAKAMKNVITTYLNASKLVKRSGQMQGREIIWQAHPSNKWVKTNLKRET